MKPDLPIALLLALGLAAPAFGQAPGAQTPAAPAAEPATVVAAATKPVADDLPPGAPREDYEFVGWCAGALTGHMALYEQVQPTLKEISKRWNTEARDEREYAAQQVAGRDLLAQFADAMKAAEKASTQALAPRGQKAIAMGRDKWAAIAAVDANARAYSWLYWGLPERCERVAKQLKSRSTLMGAVLRDNSQNAVQASAVRAVAERPPEETEAKPAYTPPATVAAAAIAAEKKSASPAPAAAKPVTAPAPAKPATTAAATTAEKKPAAPTAAKPATTPASAPSTAAKPATAAPKPVVAVKPATTWPTAEKKPASATPAAKPAVKPQTTPPPAPAPVVKLRGTITD